VGQRLVQHRGKTFPHWKRGNHQLVLHIYVSVCMHASICQPGNALLHVFLYAYCLQNKADSILEGALRPTLSCYGSVTYHINCAYAHSSIYWWALLPFGKLKECAPSHLYLTAQSLICTFVYLLLVGFASFRQLERVPSHLYPTAQSLCSH
jgi:hypothetical protein